MADVSLFTAFKFWLRLGFISFGGPAGQIAIMHRELVQEKRWISEARFLHALNYCMLLPGPEAQQLATYIGWLMHRTWGSSAHRLARPALTAITAAVVGVIASLALFFIAHIAIDTRAGGSFLSRLDGAAQRLTPLGVGQGVKRSW